jgi:2-dehydropantoate 2-reductase
MRFLVHGAGAVGCYYGAVLAHAGHPVTLVGRAARVEAIARDGMWLEAPIHRGRVALVASREAAAVAEADAVLVCVKSDDTEQAGRELLQAGLPAATPVLSFQNGVDNAERLERVLGRAVIPVVLYVAVQMAGPAQVRHHGGGDIVIGAFDQAARLAESFRAAGIGTRIDPDPRRALWDKLAINCAFNALSAIPQLPYGRLVQQPGVRELMRGVMQECSAVAAACGVHDLAAPDAAIDRIAHSMSGQRSSTAQDLRAGKRSEIDHLNGYIVRRGRELGIATPLNQTLQTLVHLMEQPADAS